MLGLQGACRVRSSSLAGGPAMTGYNPASRPSFAALARRPRRTPRTRRPLDRPHRSKYTPEQESPMALALQYPTGRYRTDLGATDLASREARERLSGPGLKAFFNIMARWKVRDEDARALLGGVTNG